jgi:hypothetical protein
LDGTPNNIWGELEVLAHQKECILNEACPGGDASADEVEIWGPERVEGDVQRFAFVEGRRLDGTRYVVVKGVQLHRLPSRGHQLN